MSYKTREQSLRSPTSIPDKVTAYFRESPQLVQLRDSFSRLRMICHSSLLIVLARRFRAVCLSHALFAPLQNVNRGGSTRIHFKVVLFLCGMISFIV